MTPRLGYVDSEPTVPVEAAHAASEFDSDEPQQPDGSGIVWGVIAGLCTLLVLAIVGLALS